MLLAESERCQYLFANIKEKIEEYILLKSVAFTVKDLKGMHFGKLTAVEPTNKRENNYTVWRCRCDCGNECYANSKKLQRGTITSCGCIPKKNMKHGTIPADLHSMVFGNLTVLKRVKNKGNRTAWLCRCVCGKEVVATTQDLRSGNTKSCGCRTHENPYFIDLSDRRIGFLTVVEKTDGRDYKGSVLWKCRCDCGKDVLYSADALLHGRIKSCGCYRKNEICGKIHKTLHLVDGTCIERLNSQKPRTDNKSGHVGVHIINENKYVAHIGFQGKEYYLGTFAAIEDAIKARQSGERMHLNFLEQYYREQKKTQ